MAIRFGTDGWRAVIADEFTFAAVQDVARAAARVVRRRSGQERPAFVVGFDRRFQSDAFARTAADVIARCGFDVLLCREPVPTPAVSIATIDTGAAGALVVTASHNPPNFNGIKLKGPNGAAVPRSFLRAVEAELASPGENGTIPAGQIREFDPIPTYFDRLSRHVNLDRMRKAGMTLVVDPMFGVDAGLLPRIVGGDSTQIIEINTAHNPLFPGTNGPEPVERNLGRLKKVVADGSANLGIAFDGDGDRIGVVNERGEYVSAQRIFALLTRYALEVRRANGPVVKSVTGTAMVDRIGEKFGVPVIETATGFTQIAEAMVAEGASVGGEESGGFAFGFHMPDRDGLLSALLLIDYTIQAGKHLSQLLGELEALVGSWCYRRIDVPLASDARDEVSHRLYQVSWPPVIGRLNVANIVPTDGTRVEFEDGSWLLVRPSGTEPLLRLYTEAHDADAVDALLSSARELLGV